MAGNIPLCCWITTLISLTFLNHASLAAGNLTRDGSSCSAPSARGRCTEYVGGNAAKNYSEDDCPMASPYLNCCDGECICCKASHVCPVYDTGAECETPSRFGEGSGASKQNGTITV